MKKKKRYSGRDWKELASILSEEKEEKSDLTGRFVAGDVGEMMKTWKELKTMSDNKEINVNKAWDKLYARISENGLVPQGKAATITVLRSSFLRVAATVLVIIGLGITAAYFFAPDALSRKITVATNSDQRNIQVGLPDGSRIFLNRNSELVYRSGFGTRNRNVMLKGEAFFEISHDASKPFIIDAGKARIKVVGTSFNVITSNSQSAVEVFVKTGRVILSSDSDSRSLDLDPGYVGTMDNQTAAKRINTNPNYLSWNTGLLVYNGQTLDVVFRDLKKVYNMNIVADDPGILENTWTSPIDNQPRETIIRLICASFNLSYSKDGDVYHLKRE